MLPDRIFKANDTREDWREAKKAKTNAGLNEKEIKRREALSAQQKKRTKEKKGRPLCEVLGAKTAAQASKEFFSLIEKDPLAEARASHPVTLRPRRHSPIRPSLFPHSPKNML